MKTERQILFKICCSALFLSFLFLLSCAHPSVVSPPEPVKKIDEPSKSIEREKEDDLSKPALISVLSAEAEKFITQGNYKDALSIYDKILKIVKEDRKLEIIAKIESILPKTPTETLEEIDQMKDIHIPRPILLYFLGLRHALENNPDKSRKALETFVSRYPDHYHYYEAVDLLNAVKKMLFDKDTLGCLLPLTGKYAILGQKALSGIEFAVQELSKKYSKEFKVVVIDTQADPETTVAGVRTLHQKNVAAIIGPLLVEEEAGKEAEKLKIPMIALTQKNDFSLMGDYLFANFITPEMQVQALGNYIFSNLGMKKAAILYPNEKYGIRYMELFSSIITEYEGEIVGIESYDGRKTDFTAPIKKITQDFSLNQGSSKSSTSGSEAAGGFQVLFIPDSPSKVNLILSQLALHDPKDIYLIGTNLLHDESLLKATKGFNRKIIIPDGFLDSSQQPVIQEFTSNFASLFNYKPQFLEAISYDTASILFITAMEKAVDSREALKNELKKKRVYECVTGHTMFDEQGVVHRPLFLMTIKNGEFVEISR